MSARFAILLTLCALAAPVRAADAPLEYELSVPEGPVLLGEWFEIVVTGELPDNVGLFPPEETGDALYGRPRAERRGAHRILSLPVTLARAGELTLEGLFLAGVELEQPLPPIDVEVVFQRPTGFTPVVAEPAEPLALPLPRADTAPFVVAALLGLLLLGALTVLAGRVPRVDRAPRPAHLVALEALARLRAHLPEDPEDVRGMVAEVSAVLRRYIEARFSMHAPARTTEEFLIEAQSRHDALGERSELLAEFLTACDLATYAGVTPGRGGLIELLETAERFVEETRQPDEPEDDDNDGEDET